MIGPDDRLLTVQEVAAMLAVSTGQVYRLVHVDDLAYIRVGRSIRISEASVGRFVWQGGHA